MLIALLFWMLTLVGCGYAAAAGGKDGRCAAILLISASVLTIPAARLGHAWARTEMGVMSVDALLLAALYALMLKSQRYFPVWMVGFQLASVVTHLSTVLAPDFTPRMYRALESVWALPITVSLVVGIYLDRRKADLAG